MDQLSHRPVESGDDVMWPVTSSTGDQAHLSEDTGTVGPGTGYTPAGVSYLAHLAGHVVWSCTHDAHPCKTFIQT